MRAAAGWTGKPEKIAMGSTRTNNFDALRAIAALMVFVSHSFALSSGTILTDPISRISRQQTDAGSIAVSVFFIISGYLITMSFTRSRSILSFVMNRALRILPALAAVLLVLAFVAGPLLSVEPIGAYFGSSEPYRFFLVNLSLYDARFYLPGVFLHNPWPRGVDGSLWTLNHEVACYALVLVLGILGLLNKYVTAALYLAGLVALKMWFGGDRAELGTFFLAGAVLYHWRPPLHRGLAWACLALWVAALLTGGFRPATATVGAYLVIYLALSPTVRLPNLARWGDLSYGTYIWAFPVEQLAAQLLGHHVTPLGIALLSTPVTLGLALLSWHFIEAPALALKQRWSYPEVAIAGSAIDAQAGARSP